MVAGVDAVRGELGGQAGWRAGGQCLTALFAFLLTACQADVPRPAGAETARPPATSSPPARLSARPPVDSILPLDEEIRRFRAKVPEAPDRLSGGERSRDALVRRWVRAVESRDSVALGSMLMSAAEFITLYYPESPYTHPPYRQAPGVRWALITGTSSQGAARVWQRHAGLPLGFTGYRCDPTPETLGRNRIWTNCLVEWKNASGRGAARLFGPILERDGEFKFLTYSSDY